jgi:hypothetical protein
MDYLGDMNGYDNPDDIDEIIDSVDSNREEADSTKEKVDSTQEKKETKYKAPGFALEFLPKDDPLYTRGYVIGIKNASHFPKKTSEKTSNKGKKKRGR